MNNYHAVLLLSSTGSKIIHFLDSLKKNAGLKAFPTGFTFWTIALLVFGIQYVLLNIFECQCVSKCLILMVVCLIYKAAQQVQQSSHV